MRDRLRRFFYDEGKGGENFRSRSKFRCRIEREEERLSKLRECICRVCKTRVGNVKSVTLINQFSFNNDVNLLTVATKSRYSHRSRQGEILLRSLKNKLFEIESD